MIGITFLTIFIISAAYAFIKWMTMHYSYFEDKGIAHLRPVYMLGNTFGFFAARYEATDFINKLYNSFPNKKIMGLFDFRTPFFIIRDPDVVKQLTVKDFDYFIDHQTVIEENCDSMFGNSLIMLRGQKWRDMRATLSPAFTGSKMRQMFELVTESAVNMSKHFIEKSTNGELLDLEIKYVFSRCTNDIIASCAFGVKVDSFRNENNDFLKAAKYVLTIANVRTIAKLLLLRIVPSIMKFLKIEFIASHIKLFFKSMVLGNMETREKQGIFRPDMINILMQIKKGSNIKDESKNQIEKNTNDGFSTVAESSVGQKTVKRTWTDDEIVAQCFLFYVAGFDSSSTLLTFLSYELMVNLDVQQKLYEEISKVNEQMNGKHISYDVLQKMAYLDMVISETLRKWPPAPFVDRLCVKDYQYNDGDLKFIIEKGKSFWIPIYSFHHDSQYFPNPERFDPERFNQENRKHINANAYLPFGTGPRNCIGSRFALMQVKAIIYYILLNFQLMPNEKTEIPPQLIKSPISGGFKNGMHLRMKARCEVTE